MLPISGTRWVGAKSRLQQPPSHVFNYDFSRAPTPQHKQIIVVPYICLRLYG